MAGYGDKPIGVTIASTGQQKLGFVCCPHVEDTQSQAKDNRKKKHEMPNPYLLFNPFGPSPPGG